jgi:hypothetical protein
VLLAAALCLALILGACNGAEGGGSATPAAVSPTAAPTANMTIADRDCAQGTIKALVDGLNAGDQTRLSGLLRASAVGLLGRTTQTPEESVAFLMERSRAGERWTLSGVQLNGRGWHGGIDFGLTLRRTAPDLPAPFVAAAGKGVIDCPAGRITLLYMG